MEPGAQAQRANSSKGAGKSKSERVRLSWRESERASNEMVVVVRELVKKRTRERERDGEVRI